MNPNLEDRLHNLADDLSAPPTEAAREAIGRRTGKLRRRRQTRRAVGAGVLVVALVAGLAAVSSLRNNDEGTYAGEPDVSTGQPDSGLAAWTLDVPGWEVVFAGEYDDVVTQSQVIPVDVEGTVAQLFRAGDDPLAATVVSRHWVHGDVVPPLDGAESVRIGNADGQLVEAGPDRYTLQWSPENTDSTAILNSYGLSRDELMDFALGLVLLDDDGIISNPGTDDTLGFDPTVLPADLEEVDLVFEREPWDIRRVDLQQGDRTLSIEVNNHGGATYEAVYAAMLATSEDVEEVEVDGRSGYLFVDPRFEEAGSVVALWQQDETTIIMTLDQQDAVEVAAAAPAELRQLLAEIRELTEGEFRALEASVE